MAVTLLPYRLTEYMTELTPEQIGEALDENVLTHFSLFGSKPYYGGFTTYGFSVRRTRSRFKKESLAPSIEGAYEARGGQVKVSLGLSPHPVLVGVFACLFFPVVVFWALAVPEFFRTGDVGSLYCGLVPAGTIYGVFWLVFQAQCGFDVRFWKHALQLREMRA